jgi:hypothetical protein
LARPVCVLLLDNADWFDGRLREDGIDLTIVMRSPDLLASVNPNDYDAVVMSARRGADSAAVLPTVLRPKTLVVWPKSPGENDTARFRDLGYRHFGTWDMATDWLLRLVGVRQ